MPAPLAPALRGTLLPPHVAALYPQLNRRLVRAVVHETGAPDAVVDDACQLAWTRLLRFPELTDPALVMAWLLRVAVRETGRQLRRETREASLDAILAAGGEEAIVGEAPSPDELFGHREQLATVHRLPRRESRAVWLFAAGLSYGEIARVTGDSPRTVQRQLQQGRSRLRGLAA